MSRHRKPAVDVAAASLAPFLSLLSQLLLLVPWCFLVALLHLGDYYEHKRTTKNHFALESSSSAFMPRGSSSKRKAADKRMWNSKKKKSNSSSLSGINEAAAEALFAEIADPEDASSANMEGMSIVNQ